MSYFKKMYYQFRMDAAEAGLAALDRARALLDEDQRKLTLSANKYAELLIKEGEMK